MKTGCGAFGASDAPRHNAVLRLVKPQARRHIAPGWAAATASAASSSTAQQQPFEPAAGIGRRGSPVVGGGRRGRAPVPRRPRPPEQQQGGDPEQPGARIGRFADGRVGRAALIVINNGIASSAQTSARPSGAQKRRGWASARRATPNSRPGDSRNSRPGQAAITNTSAARANRPQLSWGGATAWPRASAALRSARKASPAAGTTSRRRSSVRLSQVDRDAMMSSVVGAAGVAGVQPGIAGAG